jgi:hypothetical protein
VSIHTSAEGCWGLWTIEVLLISFCSMWKSRLRRSFLVQWLSKMEFCELCVKEYKVLFRKIQWVIRKERGQHSGNWFLEHRYSKSYRRVWATSAPSLVVAPESWQELLVQPWNLGLSVEVFRATSVVVQTHVEEQCYCGSGS